MKYVADLLLSKFIFEYYYGTGWSVNLKIESCERVLACFGTLPVVLEGEGFGIIHDCDGVGGLFELDKIFKEKKGAQYERYCKWYGDDNFDLTSFDIEDVNLQLKTFPKIYKKVYEH